MGGVGKSWCAFAQGLTRHLSTFPRREIGYKITDMSNQQTLAVAAPDGTTCYTNNLCKLSALGLSSPTEGVYEFATGIVAAKRLYTITLFGINVHGISDASAASPPAATFGECERRCPA